MKYDNSKMTEEISKNDLPMSPEEKLKEKFISRYKPESERLYQPKIGFSKFANGINQTLNRHDELRKISKIGNLHKLIAHDAQNPSFVSSITLNRSLNNNDEIIFHDPEEEETVSGTRAFLVMKEDDDGNEGEKIIEGLESDADEIISNKEEVRCEKEGLYDDEGNGDNEVKEPKEEITEENEDEDEDEDNEDEAEEGDAFDMTTTTTTTTKNTTVISSTFPSKLKKERRMSKSDLATREKFLAMKASKVQVENLLFGEDASRLPGALPIETITKDRVDKLHHEILTTVKNKVILLRKFV